MAAVLALALFVAAGVHGSTLGWGTDRDSLRVIDSAQAILAGHYVRSRSFGFPLHEAACAVLFATGGLVAANLGSVAATVSGIWAARRLAPEGRREALVCVLCGCPLLLANASSAIDFGWDFAAGLALCVLAHSRLRGVRCEIGYFAAALALLLLRPDNLLFLAAVTLALVVSGVPWRHVVAAAGAACVVAACVYLGLNGAGMLAHGVSTTRPFLARLPRAAVFLSAALGPGGVLALIWLARTRPGDARALWLRRALLFCWLFYLPRFAVLPDQLEYLILPVMLTIVAAVAWLPARRAALAGVLICMPSFVTLSLLRRDAVTGGVRVDPAPQWGVLAQDWAARGFAARMAGPAMTARVQAQVVAAPLHYDVYLPGYVSGAGDLVIGRAHLYRVVPVGSGLGALATVRRAEYGTIWACDAPLGPGAAWRGWEAPLEAPPRQITCTRASERVAGS